MMNEGNKEWLSALVDDELRGEALERGVDSLHGDSELLASWRAYHLIRDTVTSNLNDAVAPQLHRRISAAIEQEPTILAPKQRPQRSWVKHAAGVAIAASVTGVAIIGIQRINGVDSAQPSLQVAQPQEYLRMSPTVVASDNSALEKRDDTLTPYLVNHNEFSTSAGMQGMLPYVRIVGHKAVK